MGTDLKGLYNKKVTKEWKIAFIATCIMGLAIHMYRFTNTLLNHDALYNYYSSQNMVESGRWLLSAACRLSSYFNLPWIIGIISIFFIALTVITIVDIFKVDNSILIIVISGIIVSFPAITETFYFEYTADGYMIAMFLAAMSVELSVFERKSIVSSVLSAVCICCACAIYQAYVPFAMVLALTYFIVEIFDGRRTDREVFSWICKEVIIYASAMAAYYVIWKMFLHLAQGEVTTYLGMDKIGQMNIQNIIGAICQSLFKLILFFFEWNFIKFGLTVWSFLNLAIWLFGCFILICAICKSNVYKRKLQFALGLAAGCAIPFAVFLWLFVSPATRYSTRMEQSICLCYILIAVLGNKYMLPKWSSVMGFLLSCLILYNSVSTNIFYYYMERCNRQSYATAIEMSTRIHKLDDGNIRYICVGGSMDGWTRDDFMDPKALRALGNLKSFGKNLLVEQNNIALYLLNELGFELSYYRRDEAAEIPIRGKKDGEPVPNDWSLQFPVVSDEQRKKILQSVKYETAPCWPAAESVFVVDNTIVIKLSHSSIN